MSTRETHWLLHDPAAFVKDFFSYGYSRSGNLFAGENSYWNDLKSAVIIKLLAVFNVFTFNDYYADLIFFNFLFFFGPIAFLRLMLGYYPQKKLLFTISIFLLPSFLFWCSGLHKDGLIFSCIALTIYFFNKILQQKSFVLKYWIVVAICFAGIFALRNFLLFLMLPALFAWYIASRKRDYKWQIFLAIYFVGGILFFLLPHVNLILDFPGYIINKQTEFKALGGNSAIIVPELFPSFSSFLHFFPTALDIAFLRPHLFESHNPSYIIAGLENIFLLMILLLAFIFRDKKVNTFSFNLFLLFFSFSVLVLSGYTVPFSGSIMRYKSVVISLFITFFVVYIDEKKLFSLFKKSK